MKLKAKFRANSGGRIEKHKEEERKGKVVKNVGKTERNVVKAKERDSWLDKRGGNSVSAPFILTDC